MPDPAVVSIDIGSTFTKGALFSAEAEGLGLRGRASVPTTTDDLARGFEAVLGELARSAGVPPARKTPVFFSSSARGGLKIAALGLTPDLTLSIARLAACSAGGKIVKSYSYQLTAEDVAELEALAPDIVLFTGGTDGGSERYNLQNARRLAGSSLASVILYAGNRKIRDEVLALLSGKEALAADNVMPDVGQVNIESARDIIRRIFLDRIVDGIGLAEVVRRTGTEPKPTPLAVFDLVKQIPQSCPDWDDFCVIDMGGATTDFYSNTEAYLGEDGVILKGIHEPRVKRTVEGDLGLRVSVEALCASERESISGRLRAERLDASDFEGFVRGVCARIEAVPGSAMEERFDAVLAGACVGAAARRHAGTRTKVFTTQGPVTVQRGKDLTRVKRLIGSGGYLSRAVDGSVLQEACASAADLDERPLLPENPALYADAGYLFPLLGNLVPAFPAAAARTAVGQLAKLDTERRNS